MSYIIETWIDVTSIFPASFFILVESIHEKPGTWTNDYQASPVNRDVEMAVTNFDEATIVVNPHGRDDKEEAST